MNISTTNGENVMSSLGAQGGGPWQPRPNRTRGEFRSSWPELNKVTRTRVTKGTTRDQVVLIISPSLFFFLVTIRY
jgi:hypothetical protein